MTDAHEESLIWQLLPGDRVVHFDRIGDDYPTGTVYRVDPTASFFPYWVTWGALWRKQLPEGGFPSSSFYWTEMAKRDMRPRMTPERRASLEELRAAQHRAARSEPHKAASARYVKTL